MGQSREATQISGIQLADDQTGAWIGAHWHHLAYAYQVVDVPLEFVRPPTPPPLPAEPVAIPAERAE